MPGQIANTIRKDVEVIRRSVRQAKRALARLTSMARDMGQNHRGDAAPRRRKLRITPKRRQVLKLQGEYMGRLRHLGQRQQAQVKAVKAKSGFPAAIKLARSLVRQR